MSYIQINNYEQESHPFKPYIPSGANKLILGTFPTIESNRKKYKFFYPNPNNDFWRIIFNTAGLALSDFDSEEPIGSRKQVLKKLQLGIADIGKVILRQKGSSKDQNLFPLEFTDILSLLKKHKQIQTIIVTSSSGSNSVLSWLHQYCKLNNINFKIPSGKLPKETHFVFQNRTIMVKIISSTSRLSPKKGDVLQEMYSQVINDLYEK